MVRVKQLRSTYNKYRDRGTLKINQVANIPVAPKEYSKEQKDLWLDICSTLHSVGLLQSIGVHQIKNYCRYYKIHSEALADIEKRGNLITQETNYGITEKVNPSVTVATNAFSSMQSIADRIGFTPVAHSKVRETSIPVKEHTNQEDEFSDL